MGGLKFEPNIPLSLQDLFKYAHNNGRSFPTYIPLLLGKMINAMLELNNINLLEMISFMRECLSHTIERLEVEGCVCIDCQQNECKVPPSRN